MTRRQNESIAEYRDRLTFAAVKQFIELALLSKSGRDDFIISIGLSDGEFIQHMNITITDRNKKYHHQIHCGSCSYHPGDYPDSTNAATPEGYAHTLQLFENMFMRCVVPRATQDLLCQMGLMECKDTEAEFERIKAMLQKKG